MKVSIFYGHAASNVGDVALNRGAVELVRAAFASAEINYVFMNPEQNSFMDSARASLDDLAGVEFTSYLTVSKNALKALSDPGAFLAECRAADSDVVICASGEHLFDYLGGDNSKNMFWRVLPAFAGRRTGIPVVTLPSTFGPFETEESRRLVRGLAGSGVGLLSRDSRSEDLMRDLRAGEGQRALLDPAFFIPPPSGVERRPDVVALLLRAADQGIRINAKPQVDRPGLQQGQTVRMGAAFIDRVISDFEDLRIELVVQTDSDQEVAESILKRLDLDKVGSRVSVKRPVTIEAFMRCVGRASHVISTRFHGAILSLQMGVSVTGLSFGTHGHKMAGLFRLLGLDDHFISLSRYSEDEVLELMLAAVRGYETGDLRSRRLAGLRTMTVEALRVSALSQADSVTLDSALLLPYASQVIEAGTRAAQKKLESQWKQRLSSACSDYERFGRSTLSGLVRTAQEIPTAAGLVLGDEDALSGGEALVRASLLTSGLLDGVASIKAQLSSEVSRRQELDSALLAANTSLAAEASARARAEQELVALALTAERDRQSLAEVSDRIKIAETELATLARNRDLAQSQHLEQLAAQQGRIDELQGALAVRARSCERLQQALDTEPARFAKAVSIARAEEAGSWSGSLAYRAGSELLLHAKSPWRWPLVPFYLFREWRRFKADQLELGSDIAQGKPPLEVPPARVSGTLPAELVEPPDGNRSSSGSSRVEGLDGESPALASLVVRIASATGLHDEKLANELLDWGRTLGELEAPQLQLGLARIAAANHPTLAMYRAWYWAAQHAGDYRAACDAIMEIGQRFSAGMTARQKEAHDKLKASPSYQLSLLSLVETAASGAGRVEVVKKRICYVLHNSLPYSSGGYATRSDGMVRGLQAAGFEVIVVSRPGYPVDVNSEIDAASVPSDSVLDGVRYIRIPGPSSKGVAVTEYIERSAEALRKLFRELRPEYVLAASNYRVGLMSLIAARGVGVPFIYEVRGWWELTRLSRDPEFAKTQSCVVQTMMEREVALRADHVLTLTGPMKEQLLAYGVPDEKVTLVPNSCDPSRFLPRERSHSLAERLGIPSGVPVIGYVGTFVDYEGLDDLAEACGLLHARGKEFRLLLVGNENTTGTGRGLITETIDDIARRSGYHHWLLMPGRVPHDVVEDYYSLIDIAPFPRKPWPVCEAVSPMKPLEALAMEKAVVVSSVRALREMIQAGVTGLHFEKGSIESLADALAKLMDDSALREALGRSGRSWVERERTWRSTAAIAASAISQISR